MLRAVPDEELNSFLPRSALYLGTRENLFNLLSGSDQGKDDGGRMRLPRPAAPEEGRRDVRQAVWPGQGGDELERDPGVLGARESGVWACGEGLISPFGGGMMDPTVHAHQGIMQCRICGYLETK